MNNNSTNKKRRSVTGKGVGALVLVCLIVVLGVLIGKNINAVAPDIGPDKTPDGKPGSDISVSVTPDVQGGETDNGEQSGGITLPEIILPTRQPLPEFTPYAVESTQPEKYIGATAIYKNGETLASIADYVSDQTIDFGLGEDYSDFPGVLTFRGNNFRDGGSYGYAELRDEEFGTYWNAPTGALTSSDGYTWTGNGWTGQPLIAQWPKELRQHMNMYDWAKEKETLTEVIYASMDGYVYFYELTSGSKTRDALNLGYTFKGAGALDPRGYPVLYVGSGYNSARGGSHAFIISLLDCSILYEFGQYDNFALRAWHMFDSSALVDAETDTLIYPGESGILYLLRLNTNYDESAGTLSMEPEVVKWRYSAARSYGWLGFEASAAVWRGHLFLPDNGGNLICLDLNTLEVVWAQDILDDSNATPMIELENGHPYLYVSTSFHYGWRGTNTAEIPIWKIDAETGEIVWKHSYSCYTVKDVSGGVQGSPAMGKHDLEDLVFFPVSRYPTPAAGWLVALNKETGEQVWNVETQVYSWSSPTAFYTRDGKGYLIYCTSGGYMYLLDGLTGEMLDFMNLGSNVEASPAIFENTVVVGTRNNGIWGVNMK